jgi:hypothetical protein
VSVSIGLSRVRFFTLYTSAMTAGMRACLPSTLMQPSGRAVDCTTRLALHKHALSPMSLWTLQTPVTFNKHNKTPPPTPQETHLASLCVVAHKAALGCIALGAAVVCGGVLKGSGLTVDPPAHATHIGKVSVLTSASAMLTLCPSQTSATAELQLHNTDTIMCFLPSSDTAIAKICGMKTCRSAALCSSATAAPHALPPSPAVDADVCGQLPLLCSQLAAKAWGCWLLWQALHIDLLILTLDLWGRGRCIGREGR